MIPIDVQEKQAESCPNAHNLRTQIAQMTEEFVKYKSWTDPIVKMLWSELAGREIEPKREVSLPEIDQLARMEYEQLSEVYEELAVNLEREKTYWESWQWRLKNDGNLKAAVKGTASAMKKHLCINIPDTSLVEILSI